jgi:putative DNA primase/helicase
MTGVEKIMALIEAAENVETPPENVDETLHRLAALSPLEYDQIRDVEAERLGVRVGTLDDEVKKVRKQTRSEEFDAPNFLTDPEPWPDPVNIGDLLDRLTEVARAHLVLPKGAAEVIALWVLHAHAHDCFGISPVLAITSPTPECGKTTLLTLLGGLVPRACPASNITAAALFRAVERWRPTLLIDELDTFLKSSDELHGILNSGHQRSTAFVLRTTGDDHEPRQFRTWAPKAVALIGKLPPSLASRGIHIELRRKTASESVERLRSDRLDHLELLLRQAVRSVTDNAISLHAADPMIPEALSGRAADNWRPLIAIADLAGGEWPARARRIAQELGGRAEQTAGVVLLEDIRRVFVEGGIDRLPSEELAKKLSKMEDRPWPEFHQGRPITPRQIAKLLEPFGVRPGTIRRGGGTAKGYKQEDFRDPFMRYLPDLSVTPSQAIKIKGLQLDPSVTPSSVVTDQRSQKLNDFRSCDGVTARSSKQQTVGTPTPAGVIHIDIPTTLPEMDKPQTSAGSMPLAKNPADNLTPYGSLSLADQAGEATCGNGSSVRAKPLETDGMTEADGADANSPPLSASSENGKASNWKGRL